MEKRRKKKKKNWRERIKTQFAYHETSERKKKKKKKNVEHGNSFKKFQFNSINIHVVQNSVMQRILNVN